MTTRTDTKSTDQFEWHRKPAGSNGAPCPVCGCTTPRLKAEHRALRASELATVSPGRNGNATLWVKFVKVGFGGDYTVVGLDGT